MYRIIAEREQSNYYSYNFDKEPGRVALDSTTCMYVERYNEQLRCSLTDSIK